MFELKEKIEVEVEIFDSYKYYDHFSQKEMSVVVMVDNNKNEFVWGTTSSNYPPKGEIKKLTAKISETNTDKRNWDRTAYRVTNCKFKWFFL